MFCRYCGNQVPDHAAFCSKCGKDLRTNDHDIKEYKVNNNISHLGLNVNNDIIRIDSADQLEKVAVKENKKSGKPLKVFGIIGMIVGILCIICALVLVPEIQDSYGGTGLITGYYDSAGNYVVMDEGTIGGNSKAVEYWGNIKTFIIAAGVFDIFISFIIWARGFYSK